MKLSKEKKWFIKHYDTFLKEGWLKALAPRELEVLERRFGFNKYEQSTLKNVSIIFNVGTERIRQIESKALLKLRRISRIGYDE